MKNYNVLLSNLRKKAGLTREELSEKVGIGSIFLYFYENGYFRPNKKHLKRLSDFYKVNISVEGDDAYPAPLEEKELSVSKKPLKIRRIIFGVLSLFTLVASIVGVVLFDRSVNNYESYYGDTYNQMREKVNAKGDIGHDLITNLKYNHIDMVDGTKIASMIFYETDNLLYFNESSYSNSVVSGEFGFERIHIQFGSNLGVSSYHGRLNFSGTKDAIFFSCEFDYEGSPLTEVQNFKYNIDTGKIVSMEKVLEITNKHLSLAVTSFSSLLTKTLEKDVSFYDDFLVAREKGRVINGGLQIAGLILLVPNAILFFVFVPLFLHSLVANLRPRLVSSSYDVEKGQHKALPKDWKIEFGIPDIILFRVGEILQFGSIFLMLLGFAAKLFIPVLDFLASPVFFSAMKIGMLAGIFVEHFVTLGRIKNAKSLFKAIIKNIFVFLFVATMETILIAITNAWGYDFASLIFNYVPSNVYQVVAIDYLIFLFLFFQPPFLNSHKKAARITWHLLSLIPFAFLVVSYFISNQYALVYGVQENIFINFWFPNGFLPLSIVSVLYMYGIFVLRFFVEKNYGKHNGQYFMYGDRYAMMENAFCVALIIIVVIFDLFFQGNQIGYYLGLGYNYWILALVPFIALCKYSPNTKQVFLIEEIPARSSDE